MLFNSLEFIFVFLPVAWLGFVWLARLGNTAAVVWLSLASYAFYGSWDWRYLGLLGGSTLVNFAIGGRILRGGPHGGTWCAAGVALNLATLAVFKYADFLVENINIAAGTDWTRPGLTLPPGISFFTFTQIAFLVDAWRGAANDRYELPGYSLFVNWFPHLIAGPVLHHARMIPQFRQLHSRVINNDHIASGLTLFAIGMGKKILLADNLALVASPVFDSAAQGGEPALLAAWAGAVAYAFQIYFDFSGYSDMAVGLSRLFNVELPVNFASPYKAGSIIEFWRRWHISLSSFLRDYLYIPLGGNRKGPLRRHANLMLTMLLGGLWHGASWGFVLWGGLHGLYLILNHLWRQKTPASAAPPGRMRHAGGVALTFVIVTLAWVFFRATSMSAAVEMLQGMVGAHGLANAGWGDLTALGVADIRSGQKVLFIAALIVWLFPDSNQVAARLRSWGTVGALLAGLVLLVCLTRIGKPSEFLYFQF
jgi:alginate O-acetyltransferase complex protein AlgI